MSSPHDSHNKGQEDGAKDSSILSAFLLHTDYAPPHSDFTGFNRSDHSVWNTPEENEQRKAENDAYDAGFNNASR